MNDTLNLRFGPYLLDLAARQLLCDGEPLPVQPRVFDLLAFLAQNAHRAVDKDELQDAVWPGRVITEAALTRAIMKARKAVGDDANRQAVIKTVHGHGYHFVAEVEVEPAAEAPVAPPADSGRADPGSGANATPEAPAVQQPNDSPPDRAPPASRWGGLHWLLLAAPLVLLAVVLWRALPTTETGDPAPGPIADAVTEPSVVLDAQSIAVLPFANRSDLAQDQFFADGIQDDLLTLLAKVDSLKVISRTSVMRYRDGERSIPEIAAELGVANILEGGIQRSADQVRVNVQLIDARTDDHLWAEIYDRELNAENLFAIQSEISHHIVEALHGALDDRASRQLDERPTDNLEAYAAFVLGRQAQNRRTQESLEAAQKHFEQAVALDPGYTLAYVGLADTLNLMSTYGTASQAELWERRQALVDRALELDPESGEAWTALAALRVDQKRPEEAEPYFQRAIEFSPGYATAYHWYAYLLENAGRAEEALPVIRKALELDPMAPILTVQYARVLWRLGRVEGANAALIEGLRRNPQFLSYYMNLATNLRELGQMAESMRWIRAGIALDETLFPLRIMECKRYLDFDDEPAAAQCFDEVETAFPVASRGGRVELHQFRGDFEPALAEALALEARFPLPFAHLTVGWTLLSNRRVDEAIALVEEHWPTVMASDGAEIANIDELTAATLAGHALWHAGDRQRANVVLDNALDTMATLPRVRGDGYGEMDVAIHVLRGDRERAIEALGEAIDAKWRDNWWRFRYPFYDVMNEEPEWRALIAELEADAVRQQERYAESEARNEPLF
jgi:TolB-like protein/DNA-binding winged helix-turn-helix (wHTH) protein/Tfp pilus assembly protein PilF